MIKAGRQRNIAAWVDRLHAMFHTEQLRQLPRVEAAFGEQTRALKADYVVPGGEAVEIPFNGNSATTLAPVARAAGSG